MSLNAHICASAELNQFQKVQSVLTATLIYTHTHFSNELIPLVENQLNVKRGNKSQIIKEN